MIRGGWTITGSWPLATEMSSRLRARESAALATSVHLVCRPRRDDAPVGDWASVLRELPNHVTDWMERLQSEGVRGAGYERLEASVIDERNGPMRAVVEHAGMTVYRRYRFLERPLGT